MAHLVAHSSHWTDRFWDSRSPETIYWGESIADYARYKLLGADDWKRAECNIQYPHYTSGYSCGGAFLLFLEAAHGTNLVIGLVAEFRRDSYSDQFFVETTGQSLDALWEEFKTTVAFKAGAEESLRIRDELGFARGEPPKDAVERVTRYIEQRTGPSEEPAVQLQYDPETPPRIGAFIETYLYNTQPGGPPEKAVKELHRAGALPAVAQGEKGFSVTPPNYEELASQGYPKSKTIRFHKEGDTSMYFYTMVKQSPESGWLLERARRVSPAEKLIEELPLP